MFYEDNNFLIGAVIGLVVGMLIVWFYRNWQDTKKPDVYAEIIRMRDGTIRKLEEERKKDETTILNLTADNETMKQINPLIEQEINSLNLWKQKTKEEKEEFQETKKANSTARIEKNQLQDELKRLKSDINKAKNNPQDEDLDALKNKSKGITTKPKDTPKQ